MEKKLENIAALSQKYGSDPSYVFLGGGNTSVKNETELYIKPSGVALATIKPEQFLCISREALNRLFTLEMPENVTAREAVAKFILESSVRPLGAGRPSVETPLHGVIDYTYVVHLHPALVNGMTCAKDGKKVCKRLFPDALWIEYTDPGCTLSFFVKKQLDAVKAKTGKQPKVFFLQNHGVFVSADTPKEIDALYKNIMDKLKAEYKKAKISITAPKIPAAADEDVFENAPVFRQLLSNDEGVRPVVHCIGNALPYGGPLTPDHVVYAKSFAYVGDGSAASVEAFKKKYGYAPKVLCVKDKALFVA
ncbi:MAG: class II aldolase/adducin family protein, partial [Victivallales bacterium]|nr:class II aldolase/adducin family protein [Victivallales bacterium]